MLGLGRLYWVGRSGSTQWNNPTNLTDPTGFEAAGDNVSEQTSDTEKCDMACKENRKRYDRCAAMVGNCTHYGPTGYENAPSNGKDTTGRGGIDCVTGGGGQCASRTPNNYSCDPGVQCVGVAPIMKTRSDSTEDDGIIGTVSRGLTAANDFITSDRVVNSVAGFGDSISFNLTGHFRDWRGIGSVDKHSESYKNGERGGMVFGLAMGAAHFGRHALNVGAKKFFIDPRKYPTVQKIWSRAVGGYKGKYELHHWYYARSIYEVNAGWNLVAVTPWLNRVMSNGGLAFETFKWAFIGTNLAGVSGVYNAVTPSDDE